MPYLPTAQSFLEQSTLLISARPSTARVITKYAIPHPNPPPHPYKPSRKAQTQTDPEPTGDATQQKKPGHRRRAASLQPALVLKTYDPVSGTCLKYRTDKAAEVGRLVASLGQCGRVMAALPLNEPELVGAKQQAQEADGTGGAMEGVVQQEEGASAAIPAPKEETKAGKSGKSGTPATQNKGGAGDSAGAGGGGGGGGAGGKKKKKGKR